MTENFAFEFDQNFLENKDAFNQKLYKSIDFLNSLTESKNIFDNADAYQALIFIGKFIGYYSKLIDFNVFVSKQFEVLCANLINHFFEIRNELNFEINIDTYAADSATDLGHKRIFVLTYILYITNIINRHSVEFCSRFVLKNGLKAYLNIINDDFFISEHRNSVIHDLSTNKIGLFDYFILNVYSLSIKTGDDYKQLWCELDSVNKLFKLSKLIKSTEFNAFRVIAAIVDDKQIENLTEIYSIVETIGNYLIKSKIDFIDEKFNRSNYQISLNGKLINCRYHALKNENGSIYGMNGLLDSLYKLSVNDRLRNEIYFKKDMKEIFEVFITKGNNVEIYSTLKLLTQLSFNKTVKEDLNNNNHLKAIIENLDSKNLSAIDDPDENIIYQSNKKLIEQIKWNLNDDKSIKKEKNIENEHIMISYNTGSRELCLKIKEELESNGFKIWIDVNDIHGSSLDSMAKAVENSLCVLICITEKYRQSINCQAEAQYAFKMNKKIIPLIMQPGFENVKGWLGIIMGDKIFINFTKYEYGECIRRLKHELNSVIIKPSNLNAPLIVSTPIIQLSASMTSNINNQNQNSADEWNEEKTKEWFILKKINMAIFDHLKPCDGSMLKQLKIMKKNATEFFFQSLSKIENLKFNEMVYFSACLDKLFKDD